MKENVKKEVEELIEKLGCTVEEFPNKVNWYWISMTQKLSEDFIKEFHDKVYWPYIINYQDLSKGFREEFKYKIESLKLEKNSSSDFTVSNLHYNSHPIPVYSIGGPTDSNQYAMNYYYNDPNIIYCHNYPNMIHYDEYKFEKEYVTEFIKGNIQPSTLPEEAQELKAQEEDKIEDKDIAKNRWELMDLED